MDLATARWLVSPDAEQALRAAEQEADPASLAAATRLRSWLPAERAAAALSQVGLRRRARSKLGERADHLFLTPVGLEQATRASVAARRAERFRDAGAAVVADLGCGIGADALALMDAGVWVRPVERDEVTATFAQANLGVPVEVADAVSAWRLIGEADPAIGVFIDPARRTGAGRSWRLEDVSPSWEFTRGLLDGRRVACTKLGPGVSHSVIPDHAEAEWVSQAHTVVECAIWAGRGAVSGRRTAVVDGVALSSAGAPAAPIENIDDVIYEPDGAVVRAGLVDELAPLIRAHRVNPGIAYLSAPWYCPTPFAVAFSVREVLPFDEKVLRGWVKGHDVGALEIKKRGIEVDPAHLRRRLRPRGHAAATFIITPTPNGARVIVGERLGKVTGE